MLRRDVLIADAIDQLQRLHTQGGNVYGSMDPFMDYVEWIDKVEGYLRYLLVDEGTATRLLSPRYWKLVESGAPKYAGRLLRTELEVQRASLTAMLSELKELQGLGDRAGRLVVLDTNVLLHFQRIDLINWHDIAGESGPIRLVIPVLVLDELDDKRYTGSEDVRKRARTALRPLNDRLADLESRGWAAVGDGVTVEYLLSGGDSQPQNPDSDILDQAELLRHATGREVTVVTGDHGMRARSVARGLKVATMPSKFARTADEQRGEQYQA